MSRAVQVVWDDALARYDFGPEHPLAPVRVELTMSLARDLGLVAAGAAVGAPARLVVPDIADDELLRLVHGDAYVAAVKRCGGGHDRQDLEHGLGTSDNPTFPGMHEASALVVGATVAAARAVWTGGADHAVSVAGGLHHAMPDLASGFCVYNDPAIAIRWLLEQGATRVAYVDIDVHHGDGVERVFWDDPRVLTISLHESGRYLFPGTGFPEDRGGPRAEGMAVNVALPPGTGDAGWLRAFHAVVPPLLEAFAPQVLVTQHGCDSHVLDPLAHLALTVDGQRAAYQSLHRLAHDTADGRWVACGGGGYALVDVVPRAWTHLIGVAAGREVDPATETPESWRELVRSRVGREAPRRMTDGRDPEFRDWSSGANPEDAVDRAVLATRDSVFPLHGLDVWHW